MKSALPVPPPAKQKTVALYPSIARRLAAMLYEAFLVAAIIMAAAFLFYGAATSRLEGGLRIAFQAYLAGILGLYFVWCWRHGRTLAMKAWKLRLVRGDGTRISIGHALLRFILAAATLGVSALGMVMLWRQPHAIGGWFAVAAGIVTIGWAWFDREGQFLHDRLAGTRLVLVNEKR